MRPNSCSVITALKRIAEKDFRIIATIYGPLLRYNEAELLKKLSQGINPFPLSSGT